MCDSSIPLTVMLGLIPTGKGDGVAVAQVEPAHTGQRCLHTASDFAHEDNRDGEPYRWLLCGYETKRLNNSTKPDVGP